MPQLHIPAKYRKDPAACERLFGPDWRRPKLLADIDAIELIHGPPERILRWPDLRPYQRWMRNAIIREHGVFLGADMGLGKTGATLAAMVELLDDGIVSKVLVVAPLKVAENTWPEEIATWAFSRHLDFSIITGDEDERIASVRAEAQVYIVNRENLPWLKRQFKTRDWPYDMLVYDEASRLKAGNEHSESERLSEWGVLARMRYKFKKIVLLSGTPAPNGLIDLWGPMYICDGGSALGDSKSWFQKRWFIYDTMRRTYTPHTNAEKEIMDRLKRSFYSLKAEDYLTLPPLMTRDHIVHLPAKALKVYKTLVRDMAIEELNVEAVNNGVLSNKLLQLANGSLYDSDGREIPLHDEKLDKLDSIMTEAFERPVLVAYSYLFDIARLKKRFPYARLYGDGKNDNRDWNAGRIKMMILHPASAGHGLNFQFGGNIAVWYGLPWSLELYQQFNKRLHRSGQKADHVMLHRILARGTVDFNVLRALTRKGATQDSITDAVKVHLEEVQGTWQHEQTQTMKAA